MSSLYGCGSPHPMSLDAARWTSPPTSISSTPSTPQFIVPPSPPATAGPRHSLNCPSAPMPISQRYRPYAVSTPWVTSPSSSGGQRAFNFSGPSPSSVGPFVPPNTPVPLPPLSPQSVSSSRAQASTAPVPMVPPSPRTRARHAAFATRIPPSSPLSFLFFALSDMNQDSSDEESEEEEDFSRVQFGSRYTAAARCVCFLPVECV